MIERSAASATQHMSALPVARLLIVDDEPAHLRALCRTLRGQGYDTEGFTAGQDALAALQAGRFDLLLTDLQMPGMDGIALMRAAQETDPNLVSIIMTGQGAISTAVEAMRTGAFDYILKPLNLSMILSVLTRALSVRQLRLHNIALQEGLRLRTTELEAAQRELLEANAALERRVEQRTAALHDRIDVVSQASAHK